MEKREIAIFHSLKAKAVFRTKLAQIFEKAAADHNGTKRKKRPKSTDKCKQAEKREPPPQLAKRKQDLLKTFRSISGIAAASLDELERILPKNAALAVYQHFHKEEEL